MSNLRDNVSRIKGSTPFYTTVFVGLRAADVALQYSMLREGWASSVVDYLGGTGSSLIPTSFATGNFLNLQPYHAVIAGMALGSSLKQIYWELFLAEQEMPAATAVMVPLFNTLVNSINTFCSVWTATSQAPTLVTSWSDLCTPSLLFGIGSYFVGLSCELISEMQRKAFKDDPANKGKPFTGGLFSLARHINYGAYTLWRASYAYTAGGLPLALVVGSFFFYDFVSRGVPVLDAYCSQRYGQAWAEFKRRVPYILFPGIY